MMSEVAGKLEITVGTLTTAINRLVKKGYVERERKEEDRRIVRIRLTKKGQLVHRLHEKYHQDMINNVIQSKVQDKTQDNEILWAVCIGAWKDKNTASAKLEELKKKGYTSTFLIPR